MPFLILLSVNRSQDHIRSDQSWVTLLGLRLMLFLSQLADRLILYPTRHEIDPGGKSRRIIPFGSGELEAWTLRTGPDFTARPDLYILKFNGNASRAELAGPHPADMWPDLNCEVWAINKPGYGGSSGRANLSGLPAAATAAYEAIAGEAHDGPLLVCGNSIGTLLALYLAARSPVAGLLLRNPPPLRELVRERYGWWNAYIGSSLIAAQVPPQLDSLTNAAASHSPALFIQSAADSLVPPSYQNRVIERYAGPKQVFRIPGAEHNTPLSESDLPRYQERLAWLQDAMALKQ